MMNREEYLLMVAAEECMEVAQRIHKALRFGMEQVQMDPDDKPEQNPERLTNRERIYREYFELRAVLGMAGIDAWASGKKVGDIEAAKCQRVNHYMQRSIAGGVLEP